MSDGGWLAAAGEGRGWWVEVEEEEVMKGGEDRRKRGGREVLE